MALSDSATLAWLITVTVVLGVALLVLALLFYLVLSTPIVTVAPTCGPVRLVYRRWWSGLPTTHHHHSHGRQLDLIPLGQAQASSLNLGGD